MGKKENPARSNGGQWWKVGRVGAMKMASTVQMTTVRSDMATVAWEVDAWKSLVNKRAYTVGEEAEWASSSGDGR